VDGFGASATLDQILAATEQLLETAAGFGDDEVRAPSLLPGWSRGHVLTHVARNADGGTHLLAWARTGVETPEYTSLDARAADIEAGAGRSPEQLRTDVRDSADRFAAEYRLMPAEAWHRPVRWTAGQEHPAYRAADARLTEVLIHHVDLGAAYTPHQWPAEFVADQLNQVVAAFTRRADPSPMRLHATDTGTRHEVAKEGPLIEGSQSDLLAWLMGRSPGTDLTTNAALPAPPFLY
jgi:maleylpyruvate isomerase